MRRAAIGSASIVLLVLLLLSSLPASAEPAWPVTHNGPAGRPIQSLFWIVLSIAAVIFVLVEAALILVVVRYRSRGGTGEGVQIYGNRLLEITWTAIPALILAVIFVLTVRAMRAATAPPANALQITVIGHQWWWELQYPNERVTTANEMRIPVGRAVDLQLQSADVIHSFWVPLLAGKIDLIPGKPNHLWIEADRAGEYRGECAEFCGPQHAGMLMLVIAQPPEEYDAWVAAQRTPAASPTGMASQGQQLFLNGVCASCHAIAGTPANASIGPDLSHVASRRTLAAGVIENSPASLTRWLANPQAVKPESKMPDFKLSAEEVTVLSAYLETLK